MAAKSKTLGRMHELFAQYFVNMLENPILGENGHPLPISAAELAVMRAFMKDNNVQADPDATDDIKDVANAAKQAMRDAGIDTAEMDRIAEEFAAFAEGTMN